MLGNFTNLKEELIHQLRKKKVKDQDKTRDAIIRFVQGRDNRKHQTQGKETEVMSQFFKNYSDGSGESSYLENEIRKQKWNAFCQPKRKGVVRCAWNYRTWKPVRWQREKWKFDLEKYLELQWRIKWKQGMW